MTSTCPRSSSPAPVVSHRPPCGAESAFTCRGATSPERAGEGSGTGRTAPLDGESALLDGLRRGDDRCYRLLMDTHTDRLLQLARRYLEEEDARDAVQEAFITVYEKIDGFRAGATLSTWLHRIVVNACIGQLRKRKVRSHLAATPFAQAVPEYERGVADREPRPDQVLERRVLSEQIGRCLAELSRSHRTVLRMRDLEGLDGRETALALGISANLVKVRLCRARRACRRQLERLLPPDCLEAETGRR